MLRSLLSDDSRSASGQPLNFRGVGLGTPRRLGIAGSVIVGVILSGCSSVPDAVNPVAWYKGTVKFFAGEDTPEATAAKPGTPAADRGQPPPGTDRPFPNLSTVPDRPRTTATNDRQQVVEGLVADRDAARYSSEVIRRQSEVVNPLPPPGSALAARSAGPQSAAVPAASPPPSAVAAVAPAAVPAPVPPVAALAPPPTPEPSSPPPLPAASARPLGSPATTVQAPAPLPPPRSPAAAQDRLPTSVEETFRARIAQQQQLPAEAARNSLDAAGGYVPVAAMGFETVEVSSAGVRTGIGSPGFPAVTASLSPPSGLAASPVSLDLPGGSESKVATIVFSDGSSRLGSADTQILRAVSAIYRERGGRVVVVGHASSRTRSTDSARHRQINQQMSAARANAVANALVSLGVPRNVISVVAKADANPMYYEVMPSGEAGNRRAEIYIDS